MDSKDTTTNKRHLFADFPQISTKEWKEKITKDLKGADYERRLVWAHNGEFQCSAILS